MSKGYRLGVDPKKFEEIFGAPPPQGTIRGRYVTNPVTGDVERLQDMDPEHRRIYLGRKRGKPTNLTIMRDIEPFQTGMIEGEVISNRREMKDYMRRNDLVEYEPTHTARPTIDLDEGLDDAIEQAMQTDTADIAPIERVGEEAADVSMDNIELIE